MSRQGDRTGRRNAYTFSQLDYEPFKTVTPRCGGPDEWWCTVKGCTVEHAPKPAVIVEAETRLRESDRACAEEQHTEKTT